MIVLYRIAPNYPTKSPFQSDKFSFFKKTLKSFINGFQDIEPKTIFLLDSCPEYKKYIKDNYPFDKDFVLMNNAGNFGTYKKQIEIASQIDDYVYFQEDDYLYLKNVGNYILSALKEFDFVTPQDEYLYYFNEPRHIGKYEIKIVGNHHWREVNSTTLTFATHGKLIKENKDIMLSENIYDYPMWQKIRENYKIWCPIPTLATHLVDGILAPTIDWKKLWKYL